MNEVACALQILINVLVLFLNVSSLNRLANRAAEAVAQMIPNEPELTLRLIQKSPFDFFAIKLAVVFQKMIEVCRAGDLQKVWKVTGDLHYATGVAFKRDPRFSRRPDDELQRFLARKRSQEHVGKDVEERRVGNELSVTQLLKVTRGAGHVSHIVIISNRAKKRIELEVNRSIRGDGVEFIEQHDQLALVATKDIEHRAQRVERSLQLGQRLVTGLLRKQREQLLEEFRESKPPLLLKIDKREGIGLGSIEEALAHLR